MGRFFVFAVLAWIAYFLVKKIGRDFFTPTSHQGGPAQPPSDADLIQDPQCGAYFLKQKGIKGVVDGKVMHFCSEQCYDRYLKRHGR